jgi:hypothetical protein
MHRVVPCLVALAAAALLTASSVQTAPARLPRFLATVTGTQHFAWTLEQSDLQCSFQGKGMQDETFGTARPVKVIAARGKAGSYEFQAFSRGAWRRIVPLAGRETRSYDVVQRPTGACGGLRSELRNDCRGSNPLLSGAGIVLMRLGQKIALHVPVDTPWIERRPGTCDIRVFDLRNFFLSAVFGLRTYKPIRGGTFENRRAKTLRASIVARYCVDPAESSDIDIVLASTCGAPEPGRRGPGLSGTLTTTWSITLRRSR